MRRVRVLAACVPAALALCAAPAHAGVATIYQCSTGSGPAGTDLISGANSGAATFDTSTCGSGAGLVMKSAGTSGTEMMPGEKVNVQVSAPNGTTFIGGRMFGRQLQAYVYGADGTHESWASGYRLSDAAGSTLERCGDPGVTSHDGQGDCTLNDPMQFAATERPLPASQLYRLEFGCFLQQPGYCYRRLTDPRVEVSGFALTTEDDTAPNGVATGDLVNQSPPVSGKVSVAASDTGLGVGQAQLRIDDKLVSTQPLDGHCNDLDAGPDFAYASGHPCAASVPAVALDFTNTLNGLIGAHHLVLSVLDAAGNATPVMDRTVDFGTPPGGGAGLPPNTVLDKGVTVHRNYGRTSISGVLRDAAKHPLAGVTIAAAQVTKPATALATITTDATGHYKFTVPAGVSRTLRLSYVAADGTPHALDIALKVKAKVTIKRSKATVSLGQALTLSGTVSGGQSFKGLQVDVQYLDHRQWLTAQTIKLDAKGRISWRHKFTSRGNRTFSFRFNLRNNQRGLRLEGAQSKSVRVHIT